MCLAKIIGCETIYHPLNILKDVSSCLFCNFSSTSRFVTSEAAGDMKLTDTSWNEKFSQEKQKVCHLVQDCHPTEEAEESQSGRETQDTRERRRHCHALKHLDSEEIYKSTHTIKYIIVRRLMRTNVLHCLKWIHNFFGFEPKSKQLSARHFNWVEKTHFIHLNGNLT